jgi:hypothetical protein
MPRLTLPPAWATILGVRCGSLALPWDRTRTPRLFWWGVRGDNLDLSRASHCPRQGPRPTKMTPGFFRGRSILTGRIAQASLHDPGCDEKRKDESSNRERVEGLSARLTPVQGVVRPSRRTHQFEAKQRVPSVRQQLVRPNSAFSQGLGLPSPGTLRRQSIHEDSNT